MRGRGTREWHSDCAQKAVYRLLLCLLALLLGGSALNAYSVLTHEAIIDSAWDSSIKPLLLERYPHATPDELHEAHAYAYGGCILQDMGYYPFGSQFFSDLVHYVRSGDFVVNLIRRSAEPERIRLRAGRAGALRGGYRRATPSR